MNVRAPFSGVSSFLLVILLGQGFTSVRKNVKIVIVNLLF